MESIQKTHTEAFLLFIDSKPITVTIMTQKQKHTIFSSCNKNNKKSNQNKKKYREKVKTNTKNICQKRQTSLTKADKTYDLSTKQFR